MDRPPLERYRRSLEGLLGVPATEGNRVDVLRNGVEIFPAMLQAIREAEHTIDLLTYVYWKGEIAEELANTLRSRARAGVRVRVILDAVGAASMDRSLVGSMREDGCDVIWFRPPTTWKLWELDHRTHRKVLICDEAVAFTGGVGIAEEWTGDARNPDEWRDTHFRITGPAVDGLRAAFVGDWVDMGHEPFDERDRFPEQPQHGNAVMQVVRCPAQYGYSDLALAFAALIELAQRNLRIATAYFVPDERFVDLLCRAARRGVEVEILVPGRHIDTRVVRAAGEARYEPLLEAGVTVRVYERTMLHAKIMTVDGIISAVGSGNFDQRSMSLNDEASLVVFDADVTGILDAHYDEDIEGARPIEPEDWMERGLVQRAKERVVNVIDRKL